MNQDLNDLEREKLQYEIEKLKAEVKKTRWEKLVEFGKSFNGIVLGMIAVPAAIIALLSDCSALSGKSKGDSAPRPVIELKEQPVVGKPAPLLVVSQPKAGFPFEVKQYNLQPLPPPLEAYVIYVGNVAVTHADDCLVFRKDSFSMTFGAMKTKEIREKMTQAQIKPIVDVKSIEKIDRLKLVMTDKEYILQTMILSDKSPNSLRLILEEDPSK